MKNLFILLIISCAHISCDELCDDNKFKMSKVDYVGNQLNIKGYYYGDLTPVENPEYAYVYYFYNNGIIFYPGAVDLGIAESGELNSSIWPKIALESKISWGLFLIDNNQIEIERRVTEQCNSHFIYEKGVILNDSTFVLNYREFRRGDKVESTDEIESVFHFHPLTVKPDSVNYVIE